MAQYQITVNSELLHHLFLNNTKDSGMAELLESILNQILKAQATEQLEAEYYERTDTRKGYRNGTYPHTLSTRVGSLILRIPRIRNGAFSTDLFARFQRSEQAFILAMMEMVVNGVSTRKVEHITRELCGEEFSKSTVSELTKGLDPLITAWNNRPLSESEYPFLIVDALVIKIREDHRVRSRSALLAIGINQHGYREVLGLQIGDSESEKSWSDFFLWLKGRGLNGVDLITSDDHQGLENAIQTQLQGATWQRCQTHFMKNIVDAMPKALQEEIHSRVRGIFEAANLETARFLLNQTLDEYGVKAPKAMDVLEQGFDDATAVLSLPEKYRTKLRTTNSIERLNQEIRRRERVIRIFPNRESSLRLIGAFLLEYDEKWSGKKYLDMTDYFEWKQTGGQLKTLETMVTKISLNRDESLSLS
jgi:transposase-like protein